MKTRRMKMRLIDIFQLAVVGSVAVVVFGFGMVWTSGLNNDGQFAGLVVIVSGATIFIVSSVLFGAEFLSEYGKPKTY
jgi:hypothetical protein